MKETINMPKKQKLTLEEVRELDGYELAKSVFDEYIKTGKRSNCGALYRIYVETVAESIRDERMRKELTLRHLEALEIIKKEGTYFYNGVYKFLRQKIIENISMNVTNQIIDKN